MKIKSLKPNLFLKIENLKKGFYIFLAFFENDFAQRTTNSPATTSKSRVVHNILIYNKILPHIQNATTKLNQKIKTKYTISFQSY